MHPVLKFIGSALTLSSLIIITAKVLFPEMECQTSTFPFYVYIKLDNLKFEHCVGSILTSKHVLTAGHCCYKSKHGVVYTAYDGNTGSFDQKAFVTNFRIHDGYNRKFDNDVCLLEIDRNFEFNARTQRIKLVRPARAQSVLNSEKETNLQVLSYAIKSSDKFSDQNEKNLKCVSTTLIPIGVCQNMLKASNKMLLRLFNKKTMFCSRGYGNLPWNVTIYSGSPVMWQGKQIGIILNDSNRKNQSLLLHTRLDSAMKFLDHHLSSTV